MNKDVYKVSEEVNRTSFIQYPLVVCGIELVTEYLQKQLFYCSNRTHEACLM